MKKLLKNFFNKEFDDFYFVLMVFYILGVFSPFLILKIKGIGIYDFIKNTDENNIGQIGDFFAGTTIPVFTVVTIFLLVRTYYLQKNEFLKTAKALDEQKNIMNEEKNIVKRQSELDIFYTVLSRWQTVRENTVVTLPKWFYKCIIPLNVVPKEYLNDGIKKVKIYDYFRIINMMFRNTEFEILWKNLNIIKEGDDDLKKFTCNVLQYSSINYFTNFYLILLYIDEHISDNDMKKFVLYNLKMSLNLEERYMFSLLIEVIDLNILGEDDKVFKELLHKYSHILFFN